MLNTLISSLALFQLTLPVWGATSGVQIAGRLRTISTHAPRVGSDQLGIIRRIIGQISTHAPRVGSDDSLDRLSIPIIISTHAPRVGSDLPVLGGGGDTGISTHAPRVGSDRKGPPALTGQLRISTHAPRVGSDPQEIMLIINEYEFQLTLPVWGATHDFAVTGD